MGSGLSFTWDLVLPALERRHDAGTMCSRRRGPGTPAVRRWPSAAARYRDDWLPHADWIELAGVGHCPQLDVPLETAQLITGFTAPLIGLGTT